MSKAVMISIQPKWCELIANGKKTIEVRKTKPKLETPFKCYIYCTKDRKGWFNFRTKQKLDGKVIGEFMCCEVEAIDVPYPAYSDKLDKRIIEQSQVPYYALHKYAYHDTIYGWHISDLVIYDKPKELSEFKKHNRHCNYEHLGLATPKCSECKECQLERPPQCWRYVEYLHDE